MARILVNGVWYEQLAPTTLYETEFERLIIQEAPRLYPQFNVVPFKCTVSTEQGVAARPDLALIDLAYREWWVVEVEMAHHSLHSHVLPQVRSLSEAIYGRAEAEYLCKQRPALDRHRVLELMKGRQPRVLVLVNAARPDWGVHLARFDAVVGVFEIFRSETNRHVYRINGHHPAPDEGVLSGCFCDSMLLHFLRIESPSAVNLPTSGRIILHYNDGITEWERLDAKDAVWLTPVGANPLNTKLRYELIERADGALMLRECGRFRGGG